MRIIHRWLRAAVAATCVLGGLAPTAGPALAETPVPPGTSPVTPAGFDYLDTPDSCLASASGSLASPDVAIPDPGVITSTITVAGLGAFIWDVRVYTTITHTRNADLDLVLISPAGTRVTLSSDNGGDNDNVFNGTS